MLCSSWRTFHHSRSRVGLIAINIEAKVVKWTIINPFVCSTTNRSHLSASLIYAAHDLNLNFFSFLWCCAMFNAKIIHLNSFHLTILGLKRFTFIWYKNSSHETKAIERQPQKQTNMRFTCDPLTICKSSWIIKTEASTFARFHLKFFELRLIDEKNAP